LDVIATPIIESFTSTAMWLATGQSATLSWEISDADTVTLDGDPIDAVGELVVSPTEDTVYTILAENEDGVSEANVQILVSPARLTAQTFGWMGSTDGNLSNPNNYDPVG